VIQTIMFAIALYLMPSLLLAALLTCRRNLDRVQSDVDLCPDCKCALEIAAVKFKVLYRPQMQFVCPNCRL